MHPEIMRQVIAQRSREMRAQARQDQLARMAIRNRRRARHEADVFVMPAIPDYVDGSFRSGPAGHPAASEAGQASAAHHAA